jgi:DNA-binding transcriptional MerR regulator
MPLPLTVDSLDAVPESFRSEYVEKDGRFSLAVEGLEDTTALKGALKKERDAAKAAKAEAAQFAGLGFSIDEIKELVGERQKAERERAEKEGNFDKILDQHRREWEGKLTAAEQRAIAAETSERAAVVGTKLLSELTKAGASEEGIELLPDRFSARIKYELQDGKRVLTIMSADGETPMAGSNKDGTANFADLAKEAVSKYPSLFKATGAGGSGTRPDTRAGGAGNKTITRTQFAALNPQEQAATMKAGVRVVE